VRYVSAAVIAIVLGLILAGCGRVSFYYSDRSEESHTSGKAESSARRSATEHDLSVDEARGGHTLKRHVGRTDEELRERLRHGHISATSTYTDRATAEETVGAALERNRERIERWLARTGGHPNLVLDYDSSHAVGRTLHRGEAASEPCSHAIAVLKYDGPDQYHVLTSYPECR